MTRAWTIALALSTSVFGVYGCTEESTPQEDLAADLDRYQELLNDQVDITCDCHMELNYADRDACVDAQGQIRASRRRCLDDAFNQDVAASQAWVDCTLPLELEYKDCIDEELECDMLNASKPCVDDYNLGKEECIKLPQSVQRDVDDCFN